eukprot:gene16504-16318_t
MEDFYPQIRAVHIGAVAASGLLFVVRGAALNLFGAGWARSFPLRLASWVIDTVLLTAAVMLTILIQQFPFVQVWLTAKVLLLVVYIGLGAVALRPAVERRRRTMFFAAAIAVFAAIVTIALTHRAFGTLTLWS